MSRIYLPETVLDASRKRIRWLFEQFDHVFVTFSGGKDSTVVFNLALEAARALGRLPLDVMFIDQEAEWQHAIDYIRDVMHVPGVRAHWLQVPMQISNATSGKEQWLQCWDPEREQDWMREKEPDSIHENHFGTKTFADLFSAYREFLLPGQRTVTVGGVRAEESPARALGLTSYETFRGETWGKRGDKRQEHYTFYPIYDWSYTDVWKAIHEHGWPYTKVYDLQYQYGVPTREMRVSNLHHGTAVRSLFMLQEFEPRTWERLTHRLAGVNSAGHLQQSFYKPKTLPPMFKDWREYRDHLLENLATPEQRQYYDRVFPAFEERYSGKALEDLIQVQISMILIGDVYDTKLETFRASHMFDSKNRGKISGRKDGRYAGK